jgi:hypothetical protein
MRSGRLLFCLYAFVLGACGNQATPTQTLSQTTGIPTEPILAVATPTPTASPTAQPALSCENWQSWPVIPGVSESVRELYQRGQESGNNPRAFSKIGDGEISTEWFFAAFDFGMAYYDLGPYQDLQDVIDYFGGSFGRIGVAAKRGFNTHKILDPTMTDSTDCEPDESPLTCEVRLHRPAFAILSLGTNQVWKPEEFEVGMRKILEALLAQNVVPILSTKGDNLEGDHRTNRTIACLAQAYDVPLWNFWSAIQPLPNHGLQADLEHLTYGITDFSDEDALQSAWTVRNLTALQALDAVWRGVTVQP